MRSESSRLVLMSWSMSLNLIKITMVMSKQCTYMTTAALPTNK